MSNLTTVALLSISSLSLLTSAATLTLLVVGGRKAKTEVEEVREKVNAKLTNLKTALSDLEI